MNSTNTHNDSTSMDQNTSDTSFRRRQSNKKKNQEDTQQRPRQTRNASRSRGTKREKRPGRKQERTDFSSLLSKTDAPYHQDPSDEQMPMSSKTQKEIPTIPEAIRRGGRRQNGTYRADNELTQSLYNDESFDKVFDPRYADLFRTLVVTDKPIPAFDILDYSREPKDQAKLQYILSKIRRQFFANKGKTNSYYDQGLGPGFANHVRHTLKNIAHSHKYGQWQMYQRQQPVMKIVLQIIPEDTPMPVRPQLSVLLDSKVPDTIVFPMRVAEAKIVSDKIDDAHNHVAVFRRSQARGIWRRAIARDRRLAKYPIYVNPLHPDNLKNILICPISERWFKDDMDSPYLFGKRSLLNVHMPDDLKQKCAELFEDAPIPRTWSVKLPGLHFHVTTFDEPPQDQDKGEIIHWCNGGITRSVKGDITRISEADFLRLSITQVVGRTPLSNLYANVVSLKQKIEHENLLIVVGQKGAGKSHLTKAFIDTIDVFDSDDYGESLHPTLEVMLFCLIKACMLANLSAPYTMRVVQEFLFGEVVNLELGYQVETIKKGFWKWLDNAYRDLAIPVEQKNDEKHIISNVFDSVMNGPVSISTFSSWIQETGAKLGHPAVFMVHSDGDAMAVRAILRGGAVVRLLPGIPANEEFMVTRPRPFAPLQYILFAYYKADMIDFGMSITEIKQAVPSEWLKSE